MAALVEEVVENKCFEPPTTKEALENLLHEEKRANARRIPYHIT